MEHKTGVNLEKGKKEVPFFVPFLPKGRYSGELERFFTILRAFSDRKLVFWRVGELSAQEGKLFFKLESFFNQKVILFSKKVVFFSNWSSFSGKRKVFRSKKIVLS